MSSITDSSSLSAVLAPQVKLSDDFAKHDDADSGPLSLGDIGTLVEDDMSSKPYKVRSADGKTWWYRKEAIVNAEARNTDTCLVTIQLSIIITACSFDMAPDCITLALNVLFQVSII
jgi:hypothetical protein